jgi:hypothetical protein
VNRPSPSPRWWGCVELHQPDCDRTAPIGQPGEVVVASGGARVCGACQGWAAGPQGRAAAVGTDQLYSIRTAFAAASGPSLPVRTAAGGIVTLTNSSRLLPPCSPSRGRATGTLNVSGSRAAHSRLLHHITTALRDNATRTVARGRSVCALTPPDSGPAIAVALACPNPFAPIVVFV